jgi:hypothetical protein
MKIRSDERRFEMVGFRTRQYARQSGCYLDTLRKRQWGRTMHKAVILSIPALAASISVASAGPREDTLAGISRCASLPDDRAFLDCIYGAAQPMRERLGLPPALSAQQRLVPPASPALAQPVPPKVATQPGAPPQTGGVLGMFNEKGLRMAGYSFDKRGLFTVTLSDGSIWRQDANDTNFAHFGGKASEYLVTLAPGEYGKSRMNVRGEPGPYLVERTR